MWFANLSVLPFIDFIDKCIASMGIWGVEIQAVSILGASSQGYYYHYDVFYCIHAAYGVLRNPGYTTVVE